MNFFKDRTIKIKEKLIKYKQAINNNKINDIEEQSTHLSLSDKVKNIKNKSELVNLNIGGEIFTTKKETLLKDENCLFAILLNDKDNRFISTSIKNDTDNSNTIELFFDRSSDYFGYLLDYLRTGYINYNIFDRYELEELKEEAYFYEITNLIDYLEKKLSCPTIIDFKISNYYKKNEKIISETSFKYLNDLSMNKGICTDIKGWIEFELNETTAINKIYIGGYFGNLSEWYPGNGAGSIVLVSENGIDYTKVGNIPCSFTNGIVEIDLLPSNKSSNVSNNITAKYIKFVSCSYIGIGYLEILRFQDLPKFLGNK